MTILSKERLTTSYVEGSLELAVSNVVSFADDVTEAITSRERPVETQLLQEKEG